MLGGDSSGDDQACFAIIQEFLNQFTGKERGVIYKHDFIQTMLMNRELLALLSPFYSNN